MPRYEYFCQENGLTVEVDHAVDAVVRTWGELCFVAGRQFGKTDPACPVVRVLTAAPASVSDPSAAELRDAGFTKLVRRDDGVYENVTRSGDESRYMVRGRKDTVPHLHKKVKD